MGDILLVGNGFDLAHGLNTSYNDFLYIMKNWNTFYEAYQRVGSGYDIKEDDILYKYLKNASNMDEENIKKLGEIINHNSWVKYYCGCEAEIDGWIDFEREIYPVINLFSKVIKQRNYFPISYGTSGVEIRISKNAFDNMDLSIAELWKDYFSVDGNNLIVKSCYGSRQYGLLKKKMLKSLRKSFDDFIKAFEIYIYEFVYREKDVPILKQIRCINPEFVISFNYTLTEKLYGINAENVHHIHGMIREDLSSGNNNMIVGVNEQENQDLDFIYFVKYFQRIQKASGVKYKKFIESYISNNSGRWEKQTYKLYIYGHSLDETDADILRYIIGTEDKTGHLNLNPKKVIIYFYDSSDYEQKVINLIKLYGRSIVEAYMESGLFEFVPTTVHYI